MRKIPTAFLRDENDRKHVTRDVNPECQWVFDGEGTATRKYDGTSVMFDGERWWARREVKAGKTPPAGFRVEQHDDVTGKTVGYEPVEQSAYAKYVDEAVRARSPGAGLAAGTYELCGPKVNGNPEGLVAHELVPHGEWPCPDAPRDYDGLASWMRTTQFEGIVWHHPDGRMAKLKARDFAGT